MISIETIKVKRLVLVNGDEYEKVTISKDIPEWIDKNVSDKYLAVASDTLKSTIFIDAEMIVSLELEETKIHAISS
ncbi:hypothetical protein AFL42_07330 [Oceanobacillus caeni]|uniref:Uncharacterized protein n=1 Tax=Oceanobacillus caeni TaxID=405946 RepID=A0ABR5MK48_9BACI|nr:hypothetical protein AFL42_07330 [Oceanobacillus caeni]